MEKIAEKVIDWLQASGINPLAVICFFFGIAFLAAGLLGRILKYKIEHASRRPAMITGTVLIALGLCLYGLTASAEWTKDITLHGIVDTLFVIVAIASCFFAYYMRSRLQELQSTSRQLVETVSQSAKTSSEQIVKEVSEAEAKLVRHVEDATRHLLIGLPAIFDRALQLIDGAERELWYVGFVANFGYAHQFRADISNEYARLSPRYGSNKSLAEAVEFLKRRLREAAHNVPKVNILIIDGEHFDQSFLTPLSKRARYDDERADDIRTKCRDARDNLFDYIQRRHDCAAANRKGEHLDLLREASSLPIQLIIAGLPRKEGEARERVGCLVFMVGTEVLLGADEVAFREAGFYSELEEVAEVYRQMAIALTAQARPVRAAR